MTFPNACRTAASQALHGQTNKLPTDIRFLIARVNDLAIDLLLTGRYEAHTYLHGGLAHASWRLVTMPVGKRHTDPEAIGFDCDLCAIFTPGWGGIATPEEASERCRRQLGEMLEHLEALVAEGPADGREGAA